MSKLRLSVILFFLLSISLKLFANEPLKVDVIYPEVLKNNQILVLTGTVEAKQNSELAPLQSGVVEKLLVEEGDRVKAGQVLMKLDAKLAQLMLAESVATVNAEKAAKVEAERLLQEVIILSKQQLVAETLMAERKYEVEIANAKVNRANAQLKHQQEVVARHTLIAPFSGVIAKRHIDVGEWVTQQTSSFTLVENSNLRLNISIPQEYFSQLNGNSNVVVNVFSDFTDSEVISAKLDRIVGVASNSSRTFTGFVNLPKGIDLVTGMSARVEIELANIEQGTNDQNLVWLPKAAIKQHPDGGRSIFTIVNNKAKRTLVNVVKKKVNKIAVSGAPKDQPFVITGVAFLKEGDPVVMKRIDGEVK